jgi:hypothetical protein
MIKKYFALICLSPYLTLQAQNIFNVGLSISPTLNIAQVTNKNFDASHFSNQKYNLGFMVGPVVSINLYNYKMVNNVSIETGFLINSFSSTLIFDKTDYSNTDVFVSQKISFTNFRIPISVNRPVKLIKKWGRQYVSIGATYNFVQFSTLLVKYRFSLSDSGYLNSNYFGANIPLRDHYLSASIGLFQIIKTKKNRIINIGISGYYDLNSFISQSMSFNLDKNGVPTAYQTTLTPRFITLNLSLTYFPFASKSNTILTK